jgi:hypothetical protein
MVKIFDYEQCLAYVRDKLAEFPKGDLFRWCQQHRLTYQTVVALKNNALKNRVPYLLSLILQALRYKVARADLVVAGATVCYYCCFPPERIEPLTHSRIFQLLSQYGPAQLT